jgi:hypothetical protein
MNINTVLLVDQSEIPCSFDCKSLFVNGIHILDADDTNDFPIENISTELAKALNIEVTFASLSEVQLATYIAKKNNEEDKLSIDIKADNDLDEWLQGYNNNDVLAAIMLETPQGKCDKCEKGFVIDDNGISNHLKSDESIDHDEDADHVAIEHYKVEFPTPPNIINYESIGLLQGLIDDIHSTGGLIEFNDGMYAPATDSTWTDLGNSIINIENHLEKLGCAPKLLIDEVSYSSKEVDVAKLILTSS